MSKPSKSGIDRNGLDSSFDADETLKSNLIMEAQLLFAQNQADSAAEKFAEAAKIEEQLSERCAASGLYEKSAIHLFSAVSCWARAGDFHTAISLGEQLQSQPNLTPKMRQRVEDFTKTLRQRRQQWSAGLALPVGAE